MDELLFELAKMSNFELILTFIGACVFFRIVVWLDDVLLEAKAKRKARAKAEGWVKMDEQTGEAG